MSIGEGTIVWGARVTTQPEHWQRFTIGKQLAAPGRYGVVHHITEKTFPPLVAKLYVNDALASLRTDKPYRQRIVALAHHRDKLTSDLPFAFWPRRILATKCNPSDVEIPRTILGYTMNALPVTHSLTELFDKESARIRLVAQDAIHIAATLADQIARMHRHPWHFVFGDLSPNNIHVSHDFREVCFIDTDGYQFQYDAPHIAFRPPGLTEPYISPGSRQKLKARETLGAEHDDFVVAILIFQLLMMRKGLAAAHPFGSLDGDECQYIDQRRFPYIAPVLYPPPNEPLAFYNTFPAEIRAAFKQTFSTPVPVPSARWPDLLNRNMRGPWGC